MGFVEEHSRAGDTSVPQRRSLPLRAAATLGLAIFCAIVFLEVADFVRQGPARELDRMISLKVHELDSDRMDLLMKGFTFVGRTVVILAATLALVTWLLRRKARTLALLLVAVVASSILLNWLLKTYFHRVRPDLFFEIVAPLSYSFPSGHALLSSASYGAMAIVLARNLHKWRWAIYSATAAMVFSIGLSRIYLGVHWATDVLAGFAAGGFLLVAFESDVNRVREPTIMRGAHE